MNRTERIFLSPPHMSGQEQVMVNEAFAMNYIAPVGPMLERFEQDVCAYTGFQHAVAVASGTAAMHLAMRHMNIGPGDIILASTLTFIGSISPATLQGAELVFVDSARDSWNMDVNLLADELKRMDKMGIRPKAVVPTDIYGQCCNMPELISLCQKYEVPLLCDSAESLGARYRAPNNEHRTSNIEGGSDWLHAGRGAYAAVYSFNGNKIITTGGGGILASDDEVLIRHARKLATQARDPFPYYEHTEIGYNYRLSNLSAAVGVGQMAVLDQRVEKRRHLFDLYSRELGDVPGISLMPEPSYSRSTHWLTVIQIDQAHFRWGPTEIRERLEKENIESRPVWKPMHMQPVFARNRMVGGAVSEHVFQNGLCLPSGSALQDEDVHRICALIKHPAR